MSDLLQSINSELEEKQAKADGLGKEIEKARGFLAQAEPQFFALQGAIEQLKKLKASQNVSK